MTVLVDDEHDEVVEEKLESVTTRSVAVVFDDPLPTCPDLAVLSTSLALDILSDVLSLPLLSPPLSLSLSFTFSFPRPPGRTNPSGLKLPIGLLPTDEPSREDDDVARVLDLPRGCC